MSRKSKEITVQGHKITVFFLLDDKVVGRIGDV